MATSWLPHCLMHVVPNAVQYNGRLRRLISTCQTKQTSELKKVENLSKAYHPFIWPLIYLKICVWLWPRRKKHPVGRDYNFIEHRETREMKQNCHCCGSGAGTGIEANSLSCLCESEVRNHKWFDDKYTYTISKALRKSDIIIDSRFMYGQVWKRVTLQCSSRVKTVVSVVLVQTENEVKLRWISLYR